MSEFIEKFLERTKRDIQAKLEDEALESQFEKMLKESEIEPSEILALFALATKHLANLDYFHDTPDYYMENLHKFWKKLEKDIVFMKNTEHENHKVWINK